MHSSLPLCRSYGVPIQIVKCGEAIAKGCIVRACIYVGYGPCAAKFKRCLNRRHEMHDIGLTAGRPPGIPPVYCVQHRGPWTVVKRHELPDEPIAAAWNTVLVHSALFDVRIADHLMRDAGKPHIRSQTTIGEDGFQIADICNVIQKCLCEVARQ